MKKAHFHPHSVLFPLFFFACMMLAAFFSLSMVSSAACAAEVNLAWDSNSEQNLAGYKLYYTTGIGGDSYNGTGANEGNSPVTIYLKDLINSNSPTYSLTGLGDGQAYSFAVTAFTDDGVESDFSNQASITTDLPVENQTPHAEAGADQTVSEGETVYLNGANSTDLEGSLSGYRWTQISGPTVVLTDAGSIQASFVTPDVGTNGAALSFELQVTDAGGLIDTDSCTINVTWLNDAPVASAGSDRSAIPSELVTLDGSQSYDPDGDILSYEWSQKRGPAVSISNFAISSPTFRVPESTATGTAFVFELTVTDAGGLMSTDECIINIAQPISIVSIAESQGSAGDTDETSDTGTTEEETLTSSGTSTSAAPIASAGPDRTAIPNEIVTLDGSESIDTDGWIAAYQWAQIQGPAVTLLRASTDSPKFKVPKTTLQGTEFVFEISVTDGEGLVSKDECTVTVTTPFSIASTTETQDDTDTGSSTGVTSDTEADVAAGNENDETDTDITGTDAQSNAESSTNSLPDAPVSAASMGEELLPGSVELAVEAFSDPDTGDYHAKTQWQVYRTADKVCVLNALTTSSLTAFRVPEIMLDENTAYFWRARFMDNHGAVSKWSDNIEFTTGFSNTDSDGNGIPDDQEVDVTVDMNSDGLPDVQQAVIKSIMVPSCDEPIGLSIENADSVTAILSMSATDPVETGFTPEDEEKANQLPYGLINFKLEVAQPGDTATVTVHFSQPASGSAKWIKYDPIQGEWIDYSAYAEFSDDGMSVNLEFVDGGFGDDDGVANGVIVDPSGLDLSSKAESLSVEITDSLIADNTDSGDNGSGGGGGCFVTGAMDETTAGFPSAAAFFLLLLGVVSVLFFGDRKIS